MQSWLDERLGLQSLTQMQTSASLFFLTDRGSYGAIHFSSVKAATARSEFGLGRGRGIPIISER